MDKLEVALYLIQEAKDEEIRLKAYKKDMDAWERKYGGTIAGSNESYRAYVEIERKYDPVPKRSVITENIKVARRMLLRASKELY